MLRKNISGIKMKFFEDVYNDGSLWMQLKSFEFLGSDITHDRKGYTCRACQEKVRDKTQMWTGEPHSPTYHVRCYEFIYSKMMNEITNHHNNLTKDMSVEDMGELETTQELKDSIEIHVNRKDED